MDSPNPVEPESSNGKIEIVPFNPDWPAKFAHQAMLIRRALGDQALAIDHIGSTAVPGLAAKPIIDIALTVSDSSVEASYTPALESEGFLLIVREPEWYEHRLFKHILPATNLHVFSRGCVEVERVKLFRDWLKTTEADRTLYESTKRQLAARNWRFVQEYANAKTDAYPKHKFPPTPFMVNFSCDLRLTAEARISIHAKNTV